MTRNSSSPFSDRSRPDRNYRSDPIAFRNGLMLLLAVNALLWLLILGGLIWWLGE